MRRIVFCLVAVAGLAWCAVPASAYEVRTVKVQVRHVHRSYHKVYKPRCYPRHVAYGWHAKHVYRAHR